MTCTHPFKSLIVQKDATQVKTNEYLDTVIYYFYCEDCDQEMHISHLKIRGDFDSWLDKNIEEIQNGSNKKLAR